MSSQQLTIRPDAKDDAANKNKEPKQPAFANEIEQAWQLYREQLQRNFELMKIISDQQQVISRFVTNGIPQPQTPALEAAQPAPPAIPEPIAELKSIPLRHFNQLQQIFKLIDSRTVRNDGVQHLIEMIFAIHQLDEVYPDKLYMHMAIPDSTGYRHSRHLQKLGLIKNRKGKLTLTNLAIVLLQFPLETVEDFKLLIEKIKAEGVSISNYDSTDTCSWFERQAKKQ